MNHLVNVASAYLATRRVTTLMTSDVLTEPVRTAVWQKFPPERSTVGYLFTCRKCSSVWAGIAVLAASSIPGGRVLAHALALSEASIMTDSLMPAEMDL